MHVQRMGTCCYEASIYAKSRNVHDDTILDTIVTNCILDKEGHCQGGIVIGDITINKTKIPAGKDQLVAAAMKVEVEAAS